MNEAYRDIERYVILAVIVIFTLLAGSLALSVTQCSKNKDKADRQEQNASIEIDSLGNANSVLVLRKKESDKSHSKELAAIKEQAKKDFAELNKKNKGLKLKVKQLKGVVNATVTYTNTITDTLYISKTEDAMFNGTYSDECIEARINVDYKKQQSKLDYSFVNDIRVYKYAPAGRFLFVKWIKWRKTEITAKSNCGTVSNLKMIDIKKNPDR